MRINAASVICDRNKEYKFKGFSEEWLILCSYEDGKTGVTSGLKQKKIHDDAK